MSLHLQGSAYGLKELKDTINAAENIESIKDDGSGVTFKAKTNVLDLKGIDDVFESTETNFLGFRSKRELLEFTDKGYMSFYSLHGGKVEILFVGGFPIEDSVRFVNAICAEYSRITGAPALKIESPSKLEQIKKEREVPKFKISTVMTNAEVMESIMKDSFLGFSSKGELDKFKGNGKILLNKTPEGTYDLIFAGDFRKEEAKRYVQYLTEEYKVEIQEITYNNVMEKIREKKYSVESETIDNNDNILLTINVD